MTETDVRNPGGTFTKCAEWQPIETAPLNDTAVLVSDGENVWRDIYWTGLKCWFWSRDFNMRPTHWMPLPEPPSATLVRSREAR